MHVQISVVICTYNHENYISSAIDSVINQCCETSFEILIGDDCSTDNTRKILEKYYNKYPNLIRLVYPPQNLGSTRNLLNLIENAKGKYIAILDGDDMWIDSLKLQKQYNLIENDSNVGMVCSCAKIWNQEKKQYIGNLGTDIVTNIELLLLSDTDVAAPTMFIKKAKLLECIKDSKWYIENNCFYDSIITYWFALYSKILFIEEELAMYRVLSSSACHTTDDNTKIKYNKRAFSIKSRFILENNLNIEISHRVLLSEWEKISNYSIWMGNNNVRMSVSYKLGKVLLKPLKYIKELFIR